MTDDQFTDQTTFVASLFGANWTYQEVDIAIIEYDDTSTFELLGPFGAVKDFPTAQALVDSADYLGDNASIAT